jgi:isopenicillin N synthase-like dioxygenase
MASLHNADTATHHELDAALLAERVAVDAVPVIDIEPLRSGDLAGRQAVARSIGAACKDIGFFAVVNHGVPADLVARTFDVCRRFFALPVEDKAHIAIEQSPCHRGWFAVGGENLDPAKQQYAGDFKEGIKIGQDLPVNHRYVVDGIALHGPNQWPAEPVDFTPTLREYCAALTTLGRRIVRAFALVLEVPEDHFDRFFTVPMATAGPLHYPPHHGTIDERQLGAGAHTDYGAVTLLAQDDTGGLQVRNVDGVWLNVPPLPDAFVVNVGDMMARWTNDLFASTLHRVINTSGTDRYSIPFFFDPDHDAEVTAIPSCVSPERPARYAPTTGLGHLLERIDATFSYRTEPEPTGG